MAAAFVLLRLLAPDLHSFAPIVALWFASNSVIGIYNIAKYSPGIFKVLTACTCSYLLALCTCLGASNLCCFAPAFADPLRWRRCSPPRIGSATFCATMLAPGEAFPACFWLSLGADPDL
jgi:hypothetical protein